MPTRKKNAVSKSSVSAHQSAKNASESSQKKQHPHVEEKQTPISFVASKKSETQWIPAAPENPMPDEKKASEYTEKSHYIAFKAKVDSLNLRAKEIATAKPAEFIWFIKEVLEVIKLDIYLSEVPEKQVLLKEIPKNIEGFFIAHKNNVETIAELLCVLSENNVEYYYDFAWLHEEMHQVFDSSVEKLRESLLTVLSDPKERAKQNKKVSIHTLALIMQSLSEWRVQPKPELLEILLQLIEASCKKGIPSREDAFRILCGVSEFGTYKIFKNTPARAEMFAKLANQALPLILAPHKPLQMFSEDNLVMFRISHLKSLLPKPDPKQYQFYLHKIILNASHEETVWTKATLEAKFPPGIIPHQKLIEQLEAREFSPPDEPNPQKLILNHPKSYRKENKSVFSTYLHVKHLAMLQKSNQLKVLQWYINCYSNNLSHDLSSGNITYSLEGMTTYLKILRKSVLELDSSKIQGVIQKFCAEALLPMHFKEVSADVAIDLLWLNMVFSTMVPKSDLSYSKEDQARLFKKIQAAKINLDQARALFQIKTMRWHGDIAFSQKIRAQMRKLWEKFSEDVTPSKPEKKYFALLKNALPKKHELQGVLKANYICEETGQEVDIAYLEPNGVKIAVHVEGPQHFDPVTGQRTLKTQFRNRLLQAAGWVSMDINLTAKPNTQALITEFQQLLLSPTFKKGGSLSSLSGSVEAGGVQSQAASSFFAEPKESKGEADGDFTETVSPSKAKARVDKSSFFAGSASQFQWKPKHSEARKEANTSSVPSGGSLSSLSLTSDN